MYYAKMLSMVAVNKGIMKAIAKKKVKRKKHARAKSNK